MYKFLLNSKIGTQNWTPYLITNYCNMVMWIKEELPRVTRDLRSMQVSTVVSVSRNTDIPVYYDNWFL